MWEKYRNILYKRGSIEKKVEKDFELEDEDDIVTDEEELVD